VIGRELAVLVDLPASRHVQVDAAHGAKEDHAHLARACQHHEIRVIPRGPEHEDRVRQIGRGAFGQASTARSRASASGLPRSPTPVKGHAIAELDLVDHRGTTLGRHA
jgi:hypothetical protein